MAHHTENLPPTKSQNSNTLSGLIPNSPVAFKLVEQADKWALQTALIYSSVSNF